MVISKNPYVNQTSGILRPKGVTMQINLKAQKRELKKQANRQLKSRRAKRLKEESRGAQETRQQPFVTSAIVDKASRGAHQGKIRTRERLMLTGIRQGAIDPHEDIILIRPTGKVIVADQALATITS